MPITIENLDTKARVEAEGRVLGSKLPHASIEFNFDGTRKTICLDDWMNKKSGASDLRAAINSTTIKSATALAALDAWDCKGSLFTTMFSFLSGDSQQSFAKPSQDGAFTFTLKRGVAIDDEHKRQLFMFLAAGSAACYWRQNTASSLDVTSVELNQVVRGTATPTRYNFGWESLLLRARQWVKVSYENALPDNYTRDSEVLDATIYRLMLTEVGFYPLCAADMIQEKRSGGYEFSATDNRYFAGSKKISKGVEQSIRTALNHMRFVMYIEWRMIQELVKKDA